MGIDPAAILALISDLTARLAAADAENAQLRAQIQSTAKDAPSSIPL